MTKAVQYILDSGIVHRDLKPENLFFRTPAEKEHQALYPDYVYPPFRTKRRHSSGEDDRFTGKEFVPPDVFGLSKREARPLTRQESCPSFPSTPTLPSDVQIPFFASHFPPPNRQKSHSSPSTPKQPSNDQLSFILPLHSPSHYSTYPPASPPPHSLVQESKSQLHVRA